MFCSSRCEGDDHKLRDLPFLPITVLASGWRWRIQLAPFCSVPFVSIGRRSSFQCCSAPTSHSRTTVGNECNREKRRGTKRCGPAVPEIVSRVSIHQMRSAIARKTLHIGHIRTSSLLDVSQLDRPMVGEGERGAVPVV